MSEAPAENPQVAAARLGTVTAIVRCVQSLIPPMDQGPDRFKEYWDVRNDSGEFTDAELAVLGIDIAKLNNYVTLIENFNKFVNNEVPLQNNYQAVLNTARRVSA
jgi:hypothetical protein